MSKHRTTNYTEEFKKTSAKLAVDTDQTIAKTALELGIDSTTLGGWIKKYCPSINKTSTASLADLESENKQLRKELHRAKQERDILKKATAYFAGEAQ
jgi:transposase-like protein